MRSSIQRNVFDRLIRDAIKDSEKGLVSFGMNPEETKFFCQFGNVRAYDISALNAFYRAQAHYYRIHKPRVGNSLKEKQHVLD